MTEPTKDQDNNLNSAADIFVTLFSRLANRGIEVSMTVFVEGATISGVATSMEKFFTRTNGAFTICGPERI